MNKKLIISIVVTLIAAIVVGYSIWQKKVTVPVTQVPPPTTTQAIASAAPVATAVSGNMVTIKDWGVSFEKPASFQVVAKIPYGEGITSSVNQIFLCNESCGDLITIDYIQDSKVTTMDAKFGDTTYYYDSATQQWMQAAQTSDKEPGAISPQGPVTWIVMNTDSGLPVFGSTGRWKTYVVALSPAKILRFNITGGGITQPLTDLVKTLKKI